MSNRRPETVFSDSFLLWLFWGGPTGGYTLERPESGHGSVGHAYGTDGCEARPGGVCFANAIIRYDTDDGGLAVYRVDSFDPDLNLWHARWPD